MARAIVLAMATVAGAVSARSDGRTTWDGVYTEAQAARGEKVYAAKCVKCHLETMLGDGTATALTGTGFAANWEGVSIGRWWTAREPRADDGRAHCHGSSCGGRVCVQFNKFPAGGPPAAQAEALNESNSWRQSEAS